MILRLYSGALDGRVLRFDEDVQPNVTLHVAHEGKRYDYITVPMMEGDVQVDMVAVPKEAKPQVLWAGKEITA